MSRSRRHRMSHKAFMRTYSKADEDDLKFDNDNIVIVKFILGIASQLPVVEDISDKILTILELKDQVKNSKCTFALVGAEYQKAIDESKAEAKEKAEAKAKEAKGKETKLADFLSKEGTTFKSKLDANNSSVDKCKEIVKAAHDDFKKVKGDKELVDLANDILTEAKDQTVAEFVDDARSSHGWWYRKRIALFKVLKDVVSIRRITKGNVVLMVDGKNTSTRDVNAERKMSDVLTPDVIKRVRAAQTDKTKVLTAWEENMKELPQCKNIIDPTKPGEKVGILTKIWAGVKALAYALRECSIQEAAIDVFASILKFGFSKIAEMVVNLLTGFLGTLGKIIYFGAKAVYYFFQAKETEEDDSKAVYYGKGVGASIRVIMSIFGIGRRRRVAKHHRRQRKH